VLFAKQIIYGLDGVECDKGHFHENGIPVSHGSIPESWEFKSFEFIPVL